MSSRRAMPWGTTSSGLPVRPVRRSETSPRHAAPVNPPSTADTPAAQQAVLQQELIAKLAGVHARIELWSMEGASLSPELMDALRKAKEELARLSTMLEEADAAVTGSNGVSATPNGLTVFGTGTGPRHAARYIGEPPLRQPFRWGPSKPGAHATSPF